MPAASTPAQGELKVRATFAVTRADGSLSPLLDCRFGLVVPPAGAAESGDLEILFVYRRRDNDEETNRAMLGLLHEKLQQAMTASAAES